MELLVQPADGAVLPREHRQRVSVPRLRRPAGERIGVRRRAAATTARSRCATGIRSAPRSTATSRPIRSTRTSSTAASSRATIGGPARCRTSRRRAAPNYRVLRTAPVLFSPIDPRTLFFASNTLWKTTNGGQNWTAISPDLSRETWEVPATVGVYRGIAGGAADAARRDLHRRAVAPSTRASIWAGTDDGLIHVTRDGGHDLDERHAAGARAVGEGLDARGVALRHDVRLRRDQHAPARRPAAAHPTARATAARRGREITQRPAGRRRRSTPCARTRSGAACCSPAPSTAVYVSFDDGENWQSLRLNMPATSIRDLVDQGRRPRRRHARPRLLDPRRHHAAAADHAATSRRAPAFLFRPATAWRVRWNKNTDTPLPPDEPAAPESAGRRRSFSYLDRRRASTGPVTLEIVEAATRRGASGTSRATIPPTRRSPDRNIPDYWIRPPQRLSAAPGLHRFVWDLRYAPPPVDAFDVPDRARSPHNTPKEPQGVLRDAGHVSGAADGRRPRATGSRWC